MTRRITIKSVYETALLIVIAAFVLLTFGFSSQNAEQSSGISYNVTVWLLKVFAGGFDTLPAAERTKLITILHPIVRKAAHFSVYCALGAAVYGFLCVRIPQKKASVRIIISTLVCFAFASADEFHQLFTPGRCGCFTDVQLDTAGAFTGIMLLFAVIAAVGKIKKRRQRKRDTVQNRA